MTKCPWIRDLNEGCPYFAAGASPRYERRPSLLRTWHSVRLRSQSASRSDGAMARSETLQAIFRVTHGPTVLFCTPQEEADRYQSARVALLGGHHRRVVTECRSITREEPLRFDLKVEGCVVSEAKAVQEVLPTREARQPSRAKLSTESLGLLTDLYVKEMASCICRLIVTGADDRWAGSIGARRARGGNVPTPFPAVPVPPVHEPGK